MRDLRAELSSAIGYAELGERHASKAKQYLEKIQTVLSRMESSISYALGEEIDDKLSIEEPSDPEMLRGKRVLLVEDNRMNREILKEILIDHGLEVEEAGDGSEAAAIVKEKEPGYYHFILMDIEMPVMDGYEAVKAIAQNLSR